jgi:hypothetical protein
MPLSRRVLSLLSLIVLGAIAASLALFIGKLDLGAVGTACVYLGLIVRASLLAKRPDEFCTPDAPPAERQSWVSLVFVVLIAMSFASFVFALPARGAPGDAVELDERDLRIRHAAQRLASHIVACILIAAIVLLVMRGAEMQPWLLPLVVANLLLGLLIVSQLVENLYGVLRYRQARR